MSESIAAARPVAGVPAAVGALGARRKLQLALAAAWLLDGILQYQPSMFSRSFPQMLSDSAQGNPAVVAGPITWSAGFIDHHLAVLNAVFATIQLALGAGAWRHLHRFGDRSRLRSAARAAGRFLLAGPPDSGRGSLTWAAPAGSPAASRR